MGEYESARFTSSPESFCGQTEETLNDSLDSLSSDLNQLFIKRLMIHRQSDGRNQTEPFVSLFVVDQATRMSESDGVSHVDLWGTTSK